MMLACYPLYPGGEFSWLLQVAIIIAKIKSDGIDLGAANFKVVKTPKQYNLQY